MRVCANLEPMLDAADMAGLGVMIDMEDHSYVDRTLEVFRAAHERSPRTGVAIQSYLRRTPDDLFALPTGCRIRLVKGAYLEPSAIVVGGKRDGRSVLHPAVRDAARARAPRSTSRRTTRDLLDGVRERVDGIEDGWSRVEFQMLYGVRRDLQAQLAGQGYPVRVYIPYGTEWYPYLTRRLAERPANLWFFVSNLVRTAMTERTVAFLGGGKMGEALISGLIRSGGGRPTRSWSRAVATSARASSAASTASRRRWTTPRPRAGRARSC